jgi:hypothetical protein
MYFSRDFLRENSRSQAKAIRDSSPGVAVRADIVAQDENRTGCGIVLLL